MLQTKRNKILFEIIQFSSSLSELQNIKISFQIQYYSEDEDQLTTISKWHIS